MSSNRQKSDEKVQVTVRCRPMNHSERQKRVKKLVECNSKNREVTVATAATSMGLSISHQTKSYSFDKVFGPSATQLEVYKSVVESQLQDVLAGYNCTVLAYGQTGTGKTYTMEGERSLDEDFMWDTDPRAGIIPRTLSQLFDCLEKAGCEFSVRVSLLEIYNEEIYDLLSPLSDMPKMKIYEDNSRKGSVVVSGLTEVHVRHKSDVYDILQRGAAKRRTTATNLNEFSSRSHSVFSITVHTKDITHNNMEEEELVKIGKLNLVDLAGSENIGRSGAVDKHAREAGSINQSLLTLGRCITALVDRTPHVPYRESKLTRLLQDSLGGATKTSIIATISPGSDNFDETLSTLEYAARAKNIHNKPRVNQKLTKRALIKEYDDEIERLRREVVTLREKNGVYVAPDKYDAMLHEIEELTSSVKQREDEVDEYKTLFSNASDELNAKKEELHVLNEELLYVQQELAKQCHLKKAHVQHGKEIVKFASEVIETTDEVTNDISKVHDKVDRVKRVYENNLNTFDPFSKKMKTDVDVMCSETYSVLNESKTNVQETLQNLASYKQTNENVMEKLTAHIEQFRQSAVDAEKDNTKFLHDISAKLDEKVLKHSRSIQEYQEIVRDHCLQTRAKLNQMTELAQGILTVMHKFKQYSDNHCCQIEENVLSIGEHAQTVIKQIDEMNTGLNQMVNKEREDKVALEEALQVALEGALADVSNRLDKMHQRSLERKEIRLQNTSEIIQSVSKFRDDKKQASQDHKTKLEQEKNEISKELENYSQVATVYKSTHTTQLDETEAAVALKSEEVVDVVNSMQVDERNVVTHIENQLKFAKEVNGKFVENCKESINQNQVNDIAHVRQVTESMTALDENIDAVQVIVEDCSRNLHQNIDKYNSETLEKVVPTGCTPARRVYEYSRIIPADVNEDEVLMNIKDKFLTAELQEEDEIETNPLNEHIETESEISHSSKDDSQHSQEATLDESITIPDIGGRPFFKLRSARQRQGKVHHAAPKKQQSRIPLKPVHNFGNNGQ